MLVLSRKPDESIVFPAMGITVNILRCSKNVTRVGIEAPAGVRVLRKELADGFTEDTIDVDSFGSQLGRTQEESHKLRNQLNTLNLGLQYYRHQMDAGLVDAANLTFLRVLNQLNTMERQIVEESDQQSDGEAHALQVLLVEDDLDQRDLLAGVLRMRGCQVETAGSGTEALSFLEANPWPDYILLDMRMPNGDGASIVRQLRNSNASPNLRILATSGSSPAEFGISQGKEGVNRWFPKPLNADALYQYMTQTDETPRLKTPA